MRKQITILSVAAILLVMVSCGNNKVPSDGIFGEIPVKMYELEKELESKAKEKLGLDDDAELSADDLSNLSRQEIVSTFGELHTKYKLQLVAAIAEANKKMKGKELPYEMGDSLDYTIDKAPVITEVKLKNGNPVITAELDVVFKNDMYDVTYFNFYYFLVDGDMPLKAEKKYVYITKEHGFEKQPDNKTSLWASSRYMIKKGEKLHMELEINEKGVVPALLSRCKELKFVMKNEYNRTDVNANVESIMKELDK